MKDININSTYSDVYRSFGKLKDRLFNEECKTIEFEFLDQHCKMEYVSGERWKNLCIKYTLGENFEFHSHNICLFWLYIVLKRNNSKLVQLYDKYHLEDTNIVLISEMNVFAHYSYVLGDKYDDLLKRGDYEDINQDRKNLVLNTYKILKMLLRKNIV